MKRVLYILGLLNDSDIDWLIASGRHVTLPPGTDLVTEGEPLQSLFLVLDGRFAVILANGKKLAEMTSGEIVGEISLLDSRPPTATVRSESECEVLEIAHADLQTRLATSPEFGCRFYRALATFLAQRLRASTLQMTSGSRDGRDEQDADEIDLDLLDRVDLAGKRFKMILERIREA